MGLDKFWRAAAGLVTLASVHTVSLDAGTHVPQPQHVQPHTSTVRQSHNSQRRSMDRQSRAGEGGFALEGTTRPGYPIPSIATALCNAPPQYEFLSAGDTYGSVFVVRLEPATLVDASVGSLEDPDAYVDWTPQQQILDDIRSLSGLSWPRISKLVGVERQTLFRWRSGASADLQKVENAKTALAILIAASDERPSQEELLAWLNRRDPFYGDSPFSLIESGKYDEAHFLAMLTPTSVTTLSERGRDVSRWEKHIHETERAYVD